MNVVNVVAMSSSNYSPPRTRAPHTPVLEGEIVDAMAPRPNGIYVDCTLGAGGHAEALLAAGAGYVIGLDRDAAALELARKRLDRFGDRFESRHGPFSQLREHLDALGIDRVEGVLADLGVSSMQLDTPARGMSFRHAGPLDMRMDRKHGETALELIERLDADDLTDIIAKLGEERRARRVARCIKQALDAGQLNDTMDLRRAVVKAVGPSRIGGVDPATRTFQALRIAVNAELVELAELLTNAPQCLAPGGHIAVISFHSLEDRIVKRSLRDKATWLSTTKKPIRPTETELDENPRSRSAKLRVARRVEVT